MCLMLSALSLLLGVRTASPRRRRSVARVAEIRHSLMVAGEEKIVQRSVKM
jgi:hypothetical protein